MFNEKEEKRNKIIMIVFCVVFFWIAYISTVRGQTMDLSRQKSYSNELNKPITTIFPKEPIMFHSPKNMIDTLFLSIQADSIGEVYGLALYSYFPKNINVYGGRVFIEFEDSLFGEFLPLPPNENEVDAFPQDIYSRYQITSKTLKLLITKKCKRIIFESVARYAIIKEQEYFKNFLACYYK